MIRRAKPLRKRLHRWDKTHLSLQRNLIQGRPCVLNSKQVKHHTGTSSLDVSLRDAALDNMTLTPAMPLASRPIHTLSNMLLILKEGWRNQRLTHTCEDMRGRTVQNRRVGECRPVCQGSTGVMDVRCRVWQTSLSHAKCSQEAKIQRK